MASTISRLLPVTGEKPASSATMRTQFGAAANDIEALQTGKENSGTASSLLAAHVAAADPHPTYTTLAEVTAAVDATATAAGTVAAEAAIALHVANVDAHGAYVAAPATPTSTGTQGQWSWDGTYEYRCVATDTWVRWAPERTW